MRRALIAVLAIAGVIASLIGCAKDAVRWSLYECVQGRDDSACEKLATFQGSKARSDCEDAAKARPGAQCFYETVR